jgi:glycosyltransferase involved in cell wall biosynthesis
VQDTFFKKVSKLILTIPLPVINVKRKGRNFRRELDIPEDAFVALYMFDVRSTLNRKNPEGTIEAFKLFAKDVPNAYLILKINRWEQVDKTLFDWIPRDNRVRIVNENLDDNELADIYESANCYLSLHRSEGFGRTLVEAMQHGLEVVSTNYSGPKDFLNEKNARLVHWTETAVNPGDYPYTEGSRWADPSIKSAAIKLNEAYALSSPKRQETIREAGSHFSIEKLALKYRPILKSYVS